MPSRRGHIGTARATCLCVTRLRFAARLPPLARSLSRPPVSARIHLDSSRLGVDTDCVSTLTVCRSTSVNRSRVTRITKRDRDRVSRACSISGVSFFSCCFLVVVFLFNGSFMYMLSSGGVWRSCRNIKVIALIRD